MSPVSLIFHIKSTVNSCPQLLYMSPIYHMKHASSAGPNMLFSHENVKKREKGNKKNMEKKTGKMRQKHAD